MAETDAANKRLALRLAAAALGMFAFGYALVPLYDAFCELTGLGGKTSPEAAAEGNGAIDRSRIVTVELVGATDAALPWSFRPETTRLRLYPGEQSEVRFLAENRSSRAIMGRAVPSVTPGSAARFLRKIECFCFSEQRLAAFEARTLPVLFSVSPRIPRQISTLTLAYTFFETPAGAPPGAEPGAEGAVVEPGRSPVRRLARNQIP